MSSLNALKYKITVKPSYYAGMLIFLLYSIVITLALFVTPLSIISFIFYLILFLIAITSAKKAYQQSVEFKVSESGLIENLYDDKPYHGQISTGSFYNGFVIFLKIEVQSHALTEKAQKQFITIYKDAVSEEHYRLLARLINNGRN